MMVVAFVFGCINYFLHHLWHHSVAVSVYVMVVVGAEGWLEKVGSDSAYVSVLSLNVPIFKLCKSPIYALATVPLTLHAIKE